MDRDKNVGFVLSAEEAEQFFIRVGEAEKILGPTTLEERIIIMKSMGKSEITLSELMDMIAGKRILIVENKKGNGK